MEGLFYYQELAHRLVFNQIAGQHTDPLQASLAILHKVLRPGHEHALVCREGEREGLPLESDKAKKELRASLQRDGVEGSGLEGLDGGFELGQQTGDGLGCENVVKSVVNQIRREDSVPSERAIT